MAWCSAKQEHAPDLFTEQVAQLLESIKMPEEQLAAVPKVLHDLELVLGTHWPGNLPMIIEITRIILNSIFSSVNLHLLSTSKPRRAKDNKTAVNLHQSLFLSWSVCYVTDQVVVWL